MKVVYFLFLRTMWAASCRSVELTHALGMPAPVVNVVGRLMGTGWAFRAMRRLGWYPTFINH